ncbi:MAG: hypothetical protein OHK0052_28030 [Anaerolineales bacterium]
MTTQTYQQRFANPTHLLLEIPDGKVKTLPGESGWVNVKIEVDDAHPRTAYTDISLVQDLDGSVRAITAAKDPTRPHDIAPVTCTVELPPQLDVTLHLIHGSAHLQATRGEWQIHTIESAITLNDLEGSAEIHNVSGDVCGSNLRGALTLRTVSGDVELKACEFTAIHAHTVSGDFEIEPGALLTGPYEFHSVSGDVRLHLAPNTGCELEFRSLSGEFEISPSAIYYPRESDHRKITVQEGGAAVVFHSVSGDFALLVPQAAPAATETVSSTMQTLDLLASGKISFDEAFARLRNK